eukprot:scaffold20.g7749.t1
MGPRGSNKPARRGGCERLSLRLALAFTAALAIGLAVFRGLPPRSLAAIVRQPARAVLESRQAEPCLGSGCAEGEAGSPALAAGEAGGGGGAGSDAAVGVAGSTLGDDAPPAGAALPELFLFIGILSGRGYRHRRLAVREAWASRAQVPGLVVCKFILSEDERTPQVQKELEQYGDIVFVKEKTNYKSILYKTFFVLEYAVRHYDAKFVLKTDDDAFINVGPIIEQLRALCEAPDCARERLYLGKMARHSEVLLTPGHKWNNAIFHNHTGEISLQTCAGGISVCRVLVDVHMRMHLKFTPIEDATLGFWLMAMDLRHVDHPRFYTWAAPCCFKAPVRRLGQRLVTRFQLTDEFEEGLCSEDPWLVLHKIDSPTKMRYVGARTANCSGGAAAPLGAAAADGVVAPSIEPFLPAHKRAAAAAARAKRLAQQGAVQEQRPGRPAKTLGAQQGLAQQQELAAGSAQRSSVGAEQAGPGLQWLGQQQQQQQAQVQEQQLGQQQQQGRTVVGATGAAITSTPEVVGGTNTAAGSTSAVGTFATTEGEVAAAGAAAQA